MAAARRKNYSPANRPNDGVRRCLHCAKEISGRPSKVFCSKRCRLNHWIWKEQQQLRAEIIARHMRNMKAELDAHEFHPFGCPCLEH